LIGREVSGEGMMTEAGIEVGTAAGIEVVIKVAIEVGIDRIEVEIDRIEVGIDRIEVGIDRIEVRIDRIEVGIDRIEVGIARIEVGTKNGDAIAIAATGTAMLNEIAGGVTVTTGTKTTGTTGMTDAPGNVVGTVEDLEVGHEVTGGAGERVRNQKSDLSRRWGQKRS